MLLLLLTSPGNFMDIKKFCYFTRQITDNIFWVFCQKKKKKKKTQHTDKFSRLGVQQREQKKKNK